MSLRPASIFEELSAARKFNLADRILFPTRFCGLNFQLKTANRSTCISFKMPCETI